MTYEEEKSRILFFVACVLGMFIGMALMAVTAHCQQQSRMFDKPFIAIETASFAATITDARLTDQYFQMCKATGAICRDGNPLIGNHPSRVRTYWATVGTGFGLQFGITAIARKMTHNSRWTLLIPSILLASKSYSINVNLDHIDILHELEKKSRHPIAPFLQPSGGNAPLHPPGIRRD